MKCHLFRIKMFTELMYKFLSVCLMGIGVYAIINYFRQEMEKKKKLKDIESSRESFRRKSESYVEESITVFDPLHLFNEWLKDAVSHPNIAEPNVMCLASCSKNGNPHNRYMIVHQYGDEGFYFFTHYQSQKAKDFDENPIGAITVLWPSLNRSVRIIGSVRKMLSCESEGHFMKKPRECQIGAWASTQSAVIRDRKALKDAEEYYKEKFRDKDVPRPTTWGGYILVPTSMEFWQGQEDRVHNRLRFRKSTEDSKEEEINEDLIHKGENGWIYERLSP